MNRRINQALSILISRKQNRGIHQNALLLLLPMGLGDAMMFLDSIGHYFESKEFDDITLMSTSLAKKVFDYARPELRYTFIEYNPMEMDTNFTAFLSCLKRLGKIRYRKIVYPLRGFLTMDILFGKLDADEKICVDTIKEVNAGAKAKLRDRLIEGSTIIKFKPSDMDLIRYARVAGYVFNKEIKARMPCISFAKEEINSPYIQISVGSSRPEKCWPFERYVDVVNYILKNSSYNIVFTGSKADRVVVNDSICSIIKSGRIRNICGETSLDELFGIIGNATILIGPDSGPIHVAVALNTPTVCIVGGWDYERVYPYKVEEIDENRSVPIIVNTGVKKCYRCLLLHGRRGANNAECTQMIKNGKPCVCISDISPNLVIDAIKTIVAK